MKNILKLFIALITIGSFVACNFDDDFTSPNYVSFESGSAAVGVDIGATVTYDVAVYTGNVTGSDRTFDVMVSEASTLDAEAYSVPATVTIPANSNEGVLSVDVSDMDLGPNGETLILELQPELDLSVGAPITITVTQICPYPETRLDITFDDWASETSWNVTDAEGNVLFEGSGYSDGDATFGRVLCLDAGDYTFSITDSFGDGLTSPDLGGVSITYEGVEIVGFDGDFGEGTSVDFTLD